ncbi:hypothetical protein [Demequina oxidasica]|uniref:hypothetical protein n=1 Tax=Demequina oxidasica TaxID=676199 RepID=UPI000781F5CB|nr:hypothetical protein [Demequina oxidasica]
MSTESETSRHSSPWHRVAPRNESAAQSASGTDSGDQPESISDAHGLTPDKPPRPSVLRRTGVPTPIDADAAELVPAVTLPDAAETFPTSAVTTEIPIEGTSAAAGPTTRVPTSPYLSALTPVAGVENAQPERTRVGQDGSSPPPAGASAPRTGSVRKLAPSAAALLAIGELPQFDDDEPAFVPLYEPSAVGDVDQAESPLAHTTLVESDEPAYEPAVAAPASVPTPIVVAQQLESKTSRVTPAASTSEDNMATGSHDDAATADLQAEGTAGDQPNPQTEPTRDAPASAESDAAAASFESAEAPSADAESAEEPEPATGADDGDNGLPVVPPVSGDDDGTDGSGPMWKSPAFLIIVGIVVLVGIGFAVWALFFNSSEPVEPLEVTVTAEAMATIEPVAPTDPSDFLAAMPTTVGAYALTNSVATVADPDAEPDESGVAESDTLTYTDGTNEIQVTAWQHYDVGAAQTTFEALNDGGTDPEPVVVDGAEVGSQVTIANGADSTILWINGTAVFTAVGPADAVAGFVDGFGF